MKDTKSNKTNSITEVQRLAKLMRKFNIGALKMEGVEIYMNPEVPKFDIPLPEKIGDKTPRFDFGEPPVNKEDLTGPFPTN